MKYQFEHGYNGNVLNYLRMDLYGKDREYFYVNDERYSMWNINQEELDTIDYAGYFFKYVVPAFNTGNFSPLNY